MSDPVETPPVETPPADPPETPPEPELPAHLQQFKDFTPDQMRALLNNANAFETIQQDKDFPTFFNNVTARISGVEPAPSEPTELENLDDKELLNKFIEEKVTAGVSAVLQKLDPVLRDFSNRKLTEIRSTHPNLDGLMPKVEDFKRNNSWARSVPLDQLVKMIDYEDSGARAKEAAITELKENGGGGLKPRGGATPAPSAIDAKGMSTLQLMRAVAKEQGIALKE